MALQPAREPAGRSRRSPFLALQHRDFKWLWFAQLISISGSQMQTAAIHWHIWLLTHTPLALGLIGLSRLLPVVVFSLAGGVLADTRDRRRVVLVTQCIMMLVACALGITTHLGIVQPWTIYLLTGISAAAMAFDNPSRQALIPNLVPREHLANALTLNNILFQMATIIGPGLAGIWIAGFGVGSIYWLNAATFLAVLIALSRIRRPTRAEAPPTVSNRLALREGLQFVFRSQVIRGAMLLDFLATFFASATTLLPLFATEILHVGARGFGILSAAQSVGSLLAGAAVSLWGEIRSKGRVLLGSVALYGIATILFGLSRRFALSVFFLALAGAGDTVSTILRSTIRQLATPDSLRGRMTAVSMIFFLGGPQLGEVEAGALATLLGAPFAVALGGVATLVLVTVTAWRVPALREYQDS